MGPSCRRRKQKCSTKSRALKSSPSISPAETESTESTVNATDQEGRPDGGEIEAAADDICLTPKAARFRIPEIKTCPPAPKKRRRTTVGKSCSVRRIPIAFFAPADLDLFFYVELRGGGGVPV
ncbi:unnamed protein product [Cuscuta epithymum]|uniref:Uncharacterized protein n=1 Tax=Cuscuta epithymum TaxID=186058 RepID=A0AAV0FCS8_9ASTE|nr:unnamed protein product [Cuscuta epithymum]